MSKTRNHVFWITTPCIKYYSSSSFILLLGFYGVVSVDDRVALCVCVWLELGGGGELSDFFVL